MITDKRHHITAMALAICVLVETLSMTYMQQKGGVFYYSSSILYFISGLAVCILPFIHLGKEFLFSSPMRMVDKVIPFLVAGFILFIVALHV
ncbi:MAG: hypothetical protein JWO03_986 [Bacteroidetes bacterium]|nr:hypothetical protein [Bacteroidota bacterium]